MKRAQMLIVLPLVTTLAVAVACANSGSSSGNVGAAPADIRECPVAHDTLAQEVTITGGTSVIPEYNDCQRFIVNNKFGSLYAIYATHPTSLSIKAYEAVLVGVIRSFQGAYQQLGIRPGLNCLYLYNDRHSARIRRQVLNSLSASYFPCASVVDTSQLTGPVLESRPTTAAGFNLDADYPEVARWDWDSVGATQYIGIKCGAAWCEIGPQGFHSSPAWKPLILGLSRTMQRNIAIKGWYDEQTLAGVPPSGSDLAAVSGIRGAIFPHDSLGVYEEATWHKQWRTVAYIALSATSEKYQTGMNLSATPAESPATPLNPAKLNRIELCFGSANDCGITNPPTCNSAMAAWGWSRVVSAGISAAGAKHKCLTRWPHPSTAVALVAAARWRWVALDETTWSKCSAGCCEVH